MKNMRVSLKLIVSFLIVIVLAVLVGVVGIVGMMQINAADDAMYNGNLLPIQYIGQIRTQYNIQRAAIRDVALFDVTAPQTQEAIDALEESDAEIERLIALYDPTIETDDDRKTFDTFKNAYYGDYAAYKKEVVELGLANELDALRELVATRGAAAQAIIGPALQTSMDLNAQLGKESVEGNTALFTTMAIIEIAVLAFAIVIAMILAFYISSLISKPVTLLARLMNDLVKTGNFRLDPEEVAKVTEASTHMDEPGQTAKAYSELMKMILEKCDTLESVAGGDLTVNVSLASDKDTIGNSMYQMVDNLNKMFGEINSSSNQVSTGSVQIADGAQLLAQGATEQSATVEELSASVTQIAAQTKANAGTANETSDLAENIKMSAEQGSRQMEQMMQAVAEINESSKSIGKVIKIIDDIAFQTNILALNAAVEAARAGQHGKGFAVVADEVRSLAAKSAEAAKNTNELIETSIQKAEQGASISAETSESLQQIVQGILKTSELIADIAKSSNEQTIAISQIGDAIDQVSQVVQQNSATAEESAAASEEMSGQATLLQQLISQFKLKDGNSMSTPSRIGGGSAPAPMRSTLAPSAPETGFAVDSSGKY